MSGTDGGAMFPHELNDPRAFEIAQAMLEGFDKHYRLFRAASGSFLNANANGDRSLTGVQNGTQRVNQVSDDVYGDGTIDNFLNPAAFAQPALGTFGDAPRNGLEGPGRKALDVSLVRSFRFGTQAIQARVEAFNVFNWNNWGNPVTAITNPNFGRILTVGAPRVMQFALKYSF